MPTSRPMTSSQSNVWTPNASTSSPARRSEERQHPTEAPRPAEDRQPATRERSGSSFTEKLDKIEKVTGLAASVFNAISAVTGLAQTLKGNRTPAPADTYSHYNAQTASYGGYPSQPYNYGNLDYEEAVPVSSYRGGYAVDPGDLRDLSLTKNQVFTYKDLEPSILEYSKKYGTDPKVVAGIIAQESTFTNWGVHKDGTGHGLIGLDDHGMLPDFEKWSGTKVGKGKGAAVMKPEKQVEYLAKNIADLTKKYGDPYKAAGAWHVGDYPGNQAKLATKGVDYQGKIRDQIKNLFGGR